MTNQSTSRRILAALLLSASASAADGLGCRPPTADEQAWMDEHQVIADAVRLNRTAIGRINSERRAAGLPDVALAPVEDASEVVGRTANQRIAQPRAAAVRSAPAPLPAVVDNTALAAFPPIGSQGSLGSCACYSTTYYTMTYMVARARGIDAKTGGAATRYSPKFCYNLINGGSDTGSWITTAYQVQLNHGVPTLAAWPYDSDYRAWPTTAALWRDAIPSRMAVSGTLSGVGTDAGLADLKRMLANGYVLNFATDIYGWVFTTLANDPGTTADDAFVGQQVCHRYVNDNSGHAMTVVGYDDNLWVDLNGNSQVDPGEKGALRIANNWGTGWKNAGYAWLMYDALRTVSAVSGWDGGGASRAGAWWYDQAYWIAARPAHQPTVLGEFTLSTAKRSQLLVSLGLSGTSATTPTTQLGSSVQFAGGEYAFNGTTTAVDGTFVFDFTDRVPAGADRCYLRVQDTTSGSPCTVKSFALTDAAGAVLAPAVATSPSGGLPKGADAGTVLAWADLTVGDTIAPAAIPDLATTLVSPTSITLTWTAPGDDGSSGIATAYDVRYAAAPLDAGTWASATPAAGEPTPSASGGAESFLLTGLAAGTTWHVAVAAIDEAGNRGPISNVVVETTPAVLAITSPPTLPAAGLGAAYAAALTASGGTGARTWSYRTGHEERDPGAAVPSAAGTARGWRADDGSWTYAFPDGFTFPFAGHERTGVRVSSDGYLEFGSSVTSATGSDFELAWSTMIAVCWNDLTTAGGVQPGEDIYIRESADAVTIRWVAETVVARAGSSGPGDQAPAPVDAQVTLHRDGTIELAWRLGQDEGVVYSGVSAGGGASWAASDLCWSAIGAGTRRTWDLLGWPAGFTLDAATGQVAGTFAAPATVKLGISVADAGYPVQTDSAVLTLSAGAPAITSASSANGVAGAAFAYQITASNGPTAFSASGLPDGLSCDAAGLISGTPTAPGVTTATIGAANAGGGGTASLTITVGIQRPVVTSALTAGAHVGMPFSYQITADYAPTGFSASGLPAGLSCSASGLISGTPSAAGTVNAGITASNSSGDGSATLEIAVTLAAPVVTSATTATAVVGSAFSYQITAIGAPAGFMAAGLPSGLACSGSGLISGIPASPGVADIVLTASNAAGDGTADLRLTVVADGGGGSGGEGGGGGGGGGCGAGASTALLLAGCALCLAFRRRRPGA